MNRFRLIVQLHTTNSEQHATLNVKVACVCFPITQHFTVIVKDEKPNLLGVGVD